MNKKTARDRTALYFIISLCALFAFAAAFIAVFMHATRERITNQNRQYLEDATLQTAKLINEEFENAHRSIIMVSRLYELQLSAPEFDYRLLNDMSEPTPFDHIRFVGTDGTSWTGDGVTSDCSDREYFIKGMNGGSGVCYVPESRFTQNSLMVFYAPLYYEGKIIGVVDGVIGTKVFDDNLEAFFFGQHSNLCVTLPDGTIAITSWENTEHIDLAGDDPFSSDIISEEEKQAAEKAIRDGNTYSFRYNGKKSDGIACLAPVLNGQFTLVQTFPAAATEALTKRANSDAFKLEISLAVIFLIYVGALMLYSARRNRSLAREKDDLSQIVDSVKRLYRRFVVFDLDEDSYEYMEAGNINALGLESSGKYSDWLKAFRIQHEKDTRFWGNMEDMQVDHLQSTITKENWFAHREYPIPDGHWERLSLIKLDMDKDHTSRILGAVEDITDVKLRDEESKHALETAFRAAEAASSAKSEFLSRMSHDIRTPMNAIIGLTAIMGAHIDERDRIIDCLSKITSSSKHLLGLINEVLDMSKIESGKLILAENEFSLCSFMDDVLGIVQPTVKAKHLNLTVQIHDITHENVIGDNLRLQQVCVNILGNAVKYTDEGGNVSLTLTETGSKNSATSEYEFVFEDNGIGMSEEFISKVFIPFERAEDERVSSTQGTGLGMSIAQSIITLMGGNITVKSKLHEGTKFTVRVPMRLQNAEEINDGCLIGLPVLVADDEQVSCETTCLMLDDLGMRSEWVLTGKEAVESTCEHHKRGEDFFAVILDWKMPGMDGVETARAIRREVGDEVPIIILSAYDWTEIEEEARAAGVNTFIGKPLFKSRLRNIFVNLVSDSAPDETNQLDIMKEKDYSGKRALLVEDNALNQEIAEEILEMTGLSVELAENGKVAAEMFESSPENYYDIVFMDIQMPIMNGYDATRAIRAMKRSDSESVPIVAMSANTFSEDIRASLESGMNQHIGKPMGMDQLAAVLEKWLG